MADHVVAATVSAWKTVTWWRARKRREISADLELVGRLRDAGLIDAADELQRSVLVRIKQIEQRHPKRPK